MASAAALGLVDLRNAGMVRCGRQKSEGRPVKGACPSPSLLL